MPDGEVCNRQNGFGQLLIQSTKRVLEYPMRSVSASGVSIAYPEPRTARSLSVVNALTSLKRKKFNQ